MNLRPNFLEKGSKIAVISTARKIDQTQIQFSINLFESWGLEVVLGNTIFKSFHQFAGTDQERTEDFQYFLNDTSISAIYFARGGYGSNRVIDSIDFTPFINHPKWLVGFSDITLIHNRVNQFYGIESIHGPMPINLPTATPESLDYLHKLLFGVLPPIHWPISTFNKPGNAEGEVIGGNLSILYSLLGTDNGFNTNGKILFLEDLDEYLYHIDRMIIALKRAGKFTGLKGLIIGGFTELNDNEIPFGFTYPEIILHHCNEYNFPIFFDAPFGHISNNFPMILGANISITQNENLVQLQYLSQKSNKNA